MVKVVAFLALCIAIVGGVFYFYSTNTSLQKTPQTDPNSFNKTVSPTVVKPLVEKIGIFVPYWDSSTAPNYSDYQELYYFGISATSNGVSKTEEGYRGVKSFITSAGSKDTYLTLRLLNTDENIKILEDKQVQKDIIEETVKIATENGFKGVVLDLEITVLPFSSVVKQISTFTTDFYAEAKINNLIFKQAIYGDVFYRKRPFDVKALGESTDGLLIMAYDFHKANGEPGPNFPLSGKEKFGYDFKQMITEFTSLVPPEKLTVIFGMYGYDWTTDMKGNPTETGKAISLNDITDKYLYSCDNTNCTIKRDSLSGEVEINYVDSQSSSSVIYHKLWYEDTKSVEQKKQFLKEKGIGSSGYWAFGYF